MSLLRSPASLCERALVGRRLRRAPRPGSPVFILGHWRSGTTHLFNLMSQDPRFAWPDPFAAGMPWDFMLLGRVLRPVMEKALPRRRFIDDVAVTPESPQEDEIGLASMQNTSYYHGIYFPRCFPLRYRQGVFLDGLDRRALKRWRARFDYYNRKCLAAGAGDTLLVKNPVYTGRVAMIRDIWPDARFVHIRRNPYDVYASTLKFYRALLPRFALQEFDPATADDLILETYPSMIEKLYDGVQGLESNRFVELGFEDLDRDPVRQLEHIYDSLSLPGFSAVQGRFLGYLETVVKYRKNPHVFTDAMVEQVNRHWGGLVERWGYAAPVVDHET